MTRDEHPRFQPSTAATWFVMTGLSLAAIGLLYIFYYGGKGAFLPAVQREEPTPIAEWRALVTMLTHSFLILLAFLVGSYVMVKAGRSIVRRREARGQTKYVDGWGSYRLSQEEIDSAAQQLAEDHPTDGFPDDDDDDDTPPPTPE